MKNLKIELYRREENPGHSGHIVKNIESGVKYKLINTSSEEDLENSIEGNCEQGNETIYAFVGTRKDHAEKASSIVSILNRKQYNLYFEKVLFNALRGNYFKA